jgi:hypothetical protein
MKLDKQTKLILTGVAIIGGGVLLYSLLKPKPKRSRLEKLTGTSLPINQELKDYLNKQGGFDTQAAQQITGGAAWVPTQEQSVLMYPSTGTPNATGTGIFIKTNPYG